MCILQYIYKSNFAYQSDTNMPEKLLPVLTTTETGQQQEEDRKKVTQCKVIIMKSLISNFNVYRNQVFKLI